MDQSSHSFCKRSNLAAEPQLRDMLPRPEAIIAWLTGMDKSYDENLITPAPMIAASFNPKLILAIMLSLTSSTGALFMFVQLHVGERNYFLKLAFHLFTFLCVITYMVGITLMYLPILLCSAVISSSTLHCFTKVATIASCTTILIGLTLLVLEACKTA